MLPMDRRFGWPWITTLPLKNMQAVSPPSRFRASVQPSSSILSANQLSRTPAYLSFGRPRAIMAGRLPTNYYINDVQQINFSFSVFLSTFLPYILYGAICLFLAEVCKKAGAALKIFGKK